MVVTVSNDFAVGDAAYAAFLIKPPSRFAVKVDAAMPLSVCAERVVTAPCGLAPSIEILEGYDFWICTVLLSADTRKWCEEAFDGDYRGLGCRGRRTSHDCY